MKQKITKASKKLVSKLIDSIPVALLSLIFFSFYLYLEYNLSKPTVVFLLTFSLVASVLYLPSMKLINWVYDERYVYLLELKATDEGIGLFKFPIEAWKEIRVKEGKLFEVDNTKDVFICQRFNRESYEAIGTWRASVNDIEFLREREKIEETRDSLENMARKGLLIRARLKSIVRGAVNNIAQKMAMEAEENLLFSGEEVQKVVDEEINKSIQND